MKIFCIAMNYGKHVQEMDLEMPQKPIFFLKPETALLQKNNPFFLPDFSQDIQYELEFVVRIGKIGKCIHQRFADSYFQEVGLGIDFTARDLQKQCMKKGLPWEIAKGFDYSAPISRFLPKTQFENINNLTFKLLINGKEVQNGNTSDMIFPINQLISEISEYYTLKIGDLIFTGTPSGVGSVCIGDHIEAFLEKEKMLDFYVK